MSFLIIFISGWFLAFLFMSLKTQPQRVYSAVKQIYSRACATAKLVYIVVNHQLTTHIVGSLALPVVLFAIDAYVIPIRFGGPELFSIGDETVTLTGTVVLAIFEVMANIWFWQLKYQPWD